MYRERSRTAVNETANETANQDRSALAVVGLVSARRDRHQPHRHEFQSSQRHRRLSGQRAEVPPRSWRHGL
jgi:hypothetical protein